MAYLSIVHITDRAIPERDHIRSVAGVAARDIERFMSMVAVHLAGLLNLPAQVVRARLDFDLGDEVDCKPIGTGLRAEADLELRAYAHGVASALAPSFADLARGAA